MLERAPTPAPTPASMPTPVSTPASALTPTPTPAQAAAPRRHTRLVLAVSALWTLPIWLTTYPPMTDYPQHLAMAAILRFYHDPARHLTETYQLALSRPNALFELLTAGLSMLMPIELAGKLVVALAVAAVGAAALALVRRAGRPDWYALLALPATYNFVFYWGLIGNVLAYPQLLVAIAIADRLFERPPRARWWLALAGLSASFYLTHLQFLFVFLGCAGWLLLLRWPRARPRDLLIHASAALPALALALSHIIFAPARLSLYQQAMLAHGLTFTPVGRRLELLPICLFGGSEDNPETVLLALLLILVLVLCAYRPLARFPSVREGLMRTRFGTLALWLLALYLALPMNLIGGFVWQRMAAAALMASVAALPAPLPGRTRAAQLLLFAVLGLQLFVVSATSIEYERQAAGVRDLIERTEPGKNVAGLIFERSSPGIQTAPVFLQYPALYQVYKGGRVSFSFAEFNVSIAQYQPGQQWDDLIVEFSEWSPDHFDYARHGGRFDYFLVHGPVTLLPRIFSGARGDLEVQSRGDWHLLRRTSARARPQPQP